MKWPSYRIAVFLLALFALLTGSRLSAEEPPLRHVFVDFRESAPSVVNGLEIVAVTQSQWFLLGEKTAMPVQIILRVTNRTNGPLVFSLFDTFWLSIQDADGKELMYSGGRDGTAYVRPILLAPGQTYSVVRQATLKNREKKGEAPILEYQDGTGAWAYFRLKGKQPFKLQFAVHQKTGDSFSSPHWYFSKAEQDELKKYPQWNGSGKTGSVEFQLLRPAGLEGS